jgi:hypothetical protein
VRVPPEVGEDRLGRRRAASHTRSSQRPGVEQGCATPEPEARAPARVAARPT